MPPSRSKPHTAGLVTSTGLLLARQVAGTDFSASNNLAVYWGQNSYGQGNGDLAQQSLASYCQNSAIDIIPISFLLSITSGTGGYPVVNFANTGDACSVFPGTNLLDCPDIGKDIKTCQGLGKTVVLSIGGATYTEGGFQSEEAATAAAELIWRTFGVAGEGGGGGGSDPAPSDPAPQPTPSPSIPPTDPTVTSTSILTTSTSIPTNPDEGQPGPAPTDAASTTPPFDIGTIPTVNPPDFATEPPEGSPIQSPGPTPSAFPPNNPITDPLTTPAAPTTADAPANPTATPTDDGNPRDGPGDGNPRDGPWDGNPRGGRPGNDGPWNGRNGNGRGGEGGRRGRFNNNIVNYDGSSHNFRSHWQRRTANTHTNIRRDEQATLRPFGDAVIDGFDLDIESPTTNFLPFAKRLRALMDAAAASSNKKFYLTAAPQCVYPDAALGALFGAETQLPFDALFVQFYNNYCGIQSYVPESTTQNAFNFAAWDEWASTTSVNKDVKIYLGVPAGPTAAGSGYLGLEALKPVMEYSRTFGSFGGVMMWDASQAYANTNFLEGVKSALGGASASSSKERKRHLAGLVVKRWKA